jgi:hypothetical protein
MVESGERGASAGRRLLDESRGGWAFFGRLLIWSMRNNGPAR